MAGADGLLDGLAERHPCRREAWEGVGRQAGVLVALTDEPAPRVVLGRRADHLPLHPGEIAFPGGKREAEDHSPWDTALRESQEEVALSPALVKRRAELSPLITRTGFCVYPCIGVIPADVELSADPAEFDSVFLPPLARFADPALFRLELMSAGSRQVHVPHYCIGDDNVWGVTAAVLAQIVNVVYDAGFDLKRNWKETP
ncbi:NUDIX hydrolase [Parahaliea mediterranea]|uniref:CoA pyrophosphatase n=1 Tax=Parahaliea mediterranea TaxID=651086 RepID=A0A939DDG4_9GAMM|nr:CoA pyrophosphatase [Parahaliea mediterranea]MBN7796029.1 CoA pyrophosphatase [Parahaliea mediterranea]